jgi:hypothetical protein
MDIHDSLLKHRIEQYDTDSDKWQFCIGLSQGGCLCLNRIRLHTHASIVFTSEAAEYCGGITELDDDDYIVGVKYDDYNFIQQIRYITRKLNKPSV